jgi:hypothetical protein
MQITEVASAIKTLIITVVRVVGLVKNLTKLLSENPPLLSVKE